MNTEILKELGLTKNEITIYLFLLREGDSTTGAIIKTTKIANSRVYESLNSLISKGFATYNLQKNGKHFQATEPKIFLEKQKELKEKIEILVPQLSSLRKTEKDETTMAIYEGYEGFKIAFKKIIDDCPKGATIYITGFPEPAKDLESLRTFLSNMNLRSSAKKHNLKIILEKSAKATLGKDREKEKFTQVKYMPNGYISPTAIDIFEDYVYLFLWEDKPYVFMIKNKLIAETFKNHHNFLWKIAKS
ncbi:hypothetical protein KAT80_01350 [Candidatus Pacearchaeota archaeon]|nr:hypothetical protein [Candidatus Pacearchaeota archaeon]